MLGSSVYGARSAAPSSGSIRERASGAIKLTPLDAAAEPRNLRRLKQAVQARWGTVPLIDMLNDRALEVQDRLAVSACR